MRFCLVVALSCSTLLAQDAFVDGSPAETPLTLSQNYLWSLHRVFDPTRLFVAAVRAGFDHSENNPSGWGQGTGGYATRMASHLGRAFVRENIAFGIRELDKEDPRYFHSSSKGAWKRAQYAVSRTFVARSESGGAMPAYSTLAASFATPFFAEAWRPEPMNTGREFRSGTLGLGVTAVGNLGQEFWPDLRKKLHR